MWPLARGVIGAIVGYIVGGGLTVAVRGGSFSDDVVVTFAFIFALIGWLMGIGMWNAWGRESPG